MAVKQNGVLAHFTPTVSKYTNSTLPANSNTVAPNEYNIYTCPNGTLMSGKVFVSNNTGGALDIDIGIVEQSDVIQLDAPSAQPGSPNNYSNFLISNNTSNGYTTSIVIEVWKLRWYTDICTRRDIILDKCYLWWCTNCYHSLLGLS